MSGRFPDGFDAARAKVKSASDRALYKYLRVHILGPYSNDCHPFLTAVKRRLIDAGFKRTRLCTDRNDEPPARLQKDDRTDEEQQELREFWTKVSYEFLRNADVALFLFLDPRINRSHLPDECFRPEKVPRSDNLHGYATYETPQDANGSVVEELNYWDREVKYHGRGGPWRPCFVPHCRHNRL